ncbi:hypothetical protein HII36_51355 [Nonomuraea sp. NN258]|uniref:hypothetical protein n=1 Tax=Nonomuraea antri TaxID=2730852 RepID=UPI001569E4D4|nr:hypothetical protein [Nonomuraea antri]NRQ40169.1 hypothetical protein [Nonomuraea antri]
MTHDQGTSLRAFIDQLNELREQAGKPPLPRLRRLSRDPLPNGVKGRELHTSTTQEILAGKRRRPPSWAWVVSYVAACHAAAREGNLDLGPLDMATWNTRWLHAGNADQAATVPREGPPSPAATGPAAKSPAEQLTADELVQCYLDSHGRIGARLARLAMDGDAEASFQLALLTLLRGWNHDGESWLGRAVDAGHEGAMALRDAHDLRAQAAEVAYRYGCALEAGGATRASIAHCFYRLAAETGHPEAVAKISGSAASPHPTASAPLLTAPITDDASYAESLPGLLGDVCADHWSCQLGLSWQHAPHVIEAVPDREITAGDPAIEPRSLHGTAGGDPGPPLGSMR